MAGNLGRTHLQPLERLPIFVDDVYVFRYLRREDCVYHAGRLSCTIGKDGSAKKTIARISIAVQGSIYGNGDIQTNIVYTIATKDKTQGSVIRETITCIEFDTNKTTLAKWKELYSNTQPAGIFVAKVDVSKIPMDKLQSLPVFERFLLAHVYGIYSIDYRQDFSGVLDRTALEDHLCESEGFREQGYLESAMRTDIPTILENTDSVGDHVCTWVRANNAGYTVRTKLYNKVVSNFDAGELREPIGGHLADCVDCPNEHLRNKFLHSDVQARGCTRIEVSLYACLPRDLSKIQRKKLLEKPCLWYPQREKVCL